MDNNFSQFDSLGKILQAHGGNIAPVVPGTNPTAFQPTPSTATPTQLAQPTATPNEPLTVGNLPDSTSQPSPDNGGGNWFSNAIGNILSAPATMAARPGQAVGVGTAAIASAITGNPDYYNRAMQSINTDSKVPVLGSNIKPISEETPESVAGEALGTVGMGLGPISGGAAMGAGAAMQNNLGPLAVALSGGGGAVFGKVGQVALDKLLAPMLVKAVQKFGPSVADEAQSVVGSNLPTSLFDRARAAVNDVAGNISSVGNGTAASAPADSTESQIDSKLYSAIAPKLSNKEMSAALEKGWVTNAQSKTGTISADFSNYPGLSDAANDVSGIIKPRASATTNFNAVQQAIRDESSNIRTWGEDNKVPFNQEDLNGYVARVSPKTNLLRSDPNALSVYNQTKQVGLNTFADAMRSLQTKGGGAIDNATNPSDMWDAAISVDDKIKDELGDATFDSPQYKGVKAAAIDVRNAIRGYVSDSIRYPGQMDKVNDMNNFVSTLVKRTGVVPNDSEMALLRNYHGITSTPESEAAADFWDREMDKLHNFLDVRGNLADRAVGEQGTGALQRFRKAHPILNFALEKAGEGAGIGTAVKMAGMIGGE